MDSSHFANNITILTYKLGKDVHGTLDIEKAIQTMGVKKLTLLYWIEGKHTPDKEAMQSIISNLKKVLSLDLTAEDLLYKDLQKENRYGNLF